MSSTDAHEEQIVYSYSENIVIIIEDKADKVSKIFFRTLLTKYQNYLKTSVKDSGFIFDCVDLLHYRCHKVNLKCGGSNLGSPDWIKKTKMLQ